MMVKQFLRNTLALGISFFYALALLGADLPLVPPSNPQFFPLSEVKPGLKGVSFSVFSSAKGLERFEVHILGILHDYLGPKKDVIVAELSGDVFRAGVVPAGMSGSPVYIDGKLLGAIGYGFGDFTPQPMAGITPIADMLALPEGAVEGRPVKMPFGDMRPISLPLLASGLLPLTVGAFLPKFKSMGYETVLAAASASERSSTDASIVPGGPLSVLLIDGDIRMGAVGTATWVHDGRFVAFGHPFLNSGTASLPAAGADIVATVFSDKRAYKLGGPTGLVGSIVNDGISGVSGILGKKPSTTALDISVGDQAFHYQLAKQPSDNSTYAGLALMNSLLAAKNRQLGGTYVLEAQAQFSNGLNIPIRSVLSAYEVALEAPISLAFQDSLSVFLGQSFEKLTLDRIVVKVEQLNAIRKADLLGVDALPNWQRGVDAHLSIQLLPWKQKRTEKSISMRLPEGLAPGKYQLTVADAASSLALEKRSQLWNEPTNLSMLVERYNEQPKDQDVCVYLGRVAQGGRLDGYPTSQLPTTLKLLSRGSGVVEGAHTDQVLTRLGCFDMGQIVSGSVSNNLMLVDKKW